MQWIVSWFNWFGDLFKAIATPITSRIGWVLGLGTWAKALILTAIGGVIGFAGWAFGTYNNVLGNLPDFDLAWLSPYISVVDTVLDVSMVGTALATFISMRVLGFNFMMTWVMMRFFKRS